MDKSTKAKPEVLNTPVVGMRKRQQIANSNKTMFIWVAGASVLVAFALVISIFLVKQIMFTEKVLIKKGETIGNLNKNKEAAGELDKAVNKLRANRNLSASRSSASDNNLDVIIDAMPYAADPVALGSSLQSVLLTGTSIESLTVDTPSSDGTTDTSASVDTSSLQAVGNSQPITFSFKATGTSDQLKALFSRLNRSIRPVQIMSVQIESASEGKLTATVQAATFYQPQKKLDLKETVVKP